MHMEYTEQHKKEREKITKGVQLQVQQDNVHTISGVQRNKHGT